MSKSAIVSIIAAALEAFGRAIAAALLNGDRDAWRRVRDIIPEPLRSEALLAHEEARLEALQEADAAGDES
jgi:hypothetical protein